MVITEFAVELEAQVDKQEVHELNSERGSANPRDIFVVILSTKTKKKTKLRGLSPRTNYTDRATAACRPKLVPTFFADIGSHVVSVTDTYGRILGFLDRSCYFFFQVAPQLYSRG
jgi:hypothetical protein